MGAAAMNVVDIMTIPPVWRDLYMEINGGRIPDGEPGIRSVDAPCEVFDPVEGDPDGSGDCETDGHYLCMECKHISLETMRSRRDQCRLCGAPLADGYCTVRCDIEPPAPVPHRWMYVRKVWLFDADGTLRRCTRRNQACPNAPDEWEVIPAAQKRIMEMDWSQSAFGIVSNQGGVALGYLTEEMAKQLLADLCAMLFKKPWKKGAIQICVHAPDAGCSCRKPKPEMIFKALAALHASGLRAEEVVYVGDLETDRQTAEAARVSFMWAWEFAGQTQDEWTRWLAERAEASR